MSTPARILRLLAILGLALAFPATALAQGGHYVFRGGSAYEQGQVKQALDVSAFNWSLVSQTITIEIARGGDSEAWLGTISLNADLLDSGRFAWGVVQHEYAHQVDFALFNDAVHAQLLPLLGGHSWFDDPVHSQNAGERFASTLAWAYWPSPENCMRPNAASDEAAAMAPAAFRALLKQTLLGLGIQGASALPLTLPQSSAAPQPSRPVQTAPAKKRLVRHKTAKRKSQRR